MQQIDLEPTGYRSQDPKTGRWVQNVDKRMCRWLGIAGIGLIAWFSWSNIQTGGIPILVPFIGAVGFCVGALITLSLKSTDW